ncbi:MAG: Potassium channel [Chrysothrix sp. TS-e1954]|nr:MAG: Potassium channel [Chrysothrix sp. TS-e1954]
MDKLQRAGTRRSDEETRQQYADKDETEAEADPTTPARWWFFTSLFPLIGATFGPIASTFSICALISGWRTKVNPNNIEAEGLKLTDPPWLYAINAVSLFVAVFANLSLIAHMAGRVSFHVAHPIVTIGWFLASFLLIGLVAAAPHHLDDQPFTFSQAYYYACMAAGLYFILAILMTLVTWAVYIGKYSKEYKLTMAQRSLMLQTVAFLAYLLAAAAVYSRVENWNYLDAVYWCDVTLFTIGFGDYKPQTHLGRALIFPMAVGGIIFVGLIVASVKTLTLDSGTRKVSRRNVEKARQKVLASLDPATGEMRTGFSKHNPSADGTSELQRREREFNLMRRVQAKARFVNATTALCFSAGVWLSLWFIGAVIFWQAEHSTGGQDWSYFVALYFTYISFLTIGYGDFYPQTNSAKPAFVLWSLLALPALTVLVGALGDVMSTGFSAITVWMAEHIPAKTKALADLQRMAHDTKKGEGGAHAEAKPPGFMSDREHDGSHFDDEEHAAAAREYRPYLLIKAIKDVITHLDASPPRKYTYAEWAWFLKLLGAHEEDERGHRSARDALENEKTGVHNAKPGEQNGVVKPFSWLGVDSPLMSTESEPQWVLERLMEGLEGELKRLGDGRMSQR